MGAAARAMLSDPFRLVGTIVDGRYRIEHLAGRGGYGVVYRAWHLSFGAPIALKVLKLPDELSSDKKRAQVVAFQQEGKVLFELSQLHPSIVKAFEAGVVALFDGSVAPYLALEWLDGVSLDQELKHRRKHGIAPMTLLEVIALLHDPASGLTLAHVRGVVHRDIKPGNLFVTRQHGSPLVKILDFGIAKMLDDSMNTTAKLAETGPVSSFTPMYAAPEQWLCRLGATGTWTDVHAWALVCVELMSGKAPLLGDEAAQFMAACLDPAVRPTPRNLGLEVSNDVEEVFVRGLAVNPRDRFRDIGEFWSALRGAVQSSHTGAPWSVSMPALPSMDESTTNVRSMQPGSARRSDPTTTGPTASRSLDRSSRPSVRRRVLAGLSVGVVIGCLVVVALVKARTSPVITPGNAPAAQGLRGDSDREDLPSFSFPARSAEDGLFQSESPTIQSSAPSAVAPASRVRPAQPIDVAHRAGSRLGLELAATALSPDGGLAISGPTSVRTRLFDGSSPRLDAGSNLEKLIDHEELLHRR